MSRRDVRQPVSPAQQEEDEVLADADVAQDNPWIAAARRLRDKRLEGASEPSTPIPSAQPDGEADDEADGEADGEVEAAMDQGEEELPATAEHEELPASASADDVRQWLEERAMAGPYSDPYSGMARLDGRSRLIFDSMFSTTAVTSHQDLDKMRRWGRRPSDDTALQEIVMALRSYGAAGAVGRHGHAGNSYGAVIVMKLWRRWRCQLACPGGRLRRAWLLLQRISYTTC